MSEDAREQASTDTHKPARPMKYFKDKDGYGWLCDKDIDPDGDLREQGCWRCDEMAFPDGWTVELRRKDSTLRGSKADCIEEAAGAFRRAVSDLMADRLSSALENLERCLACDPGFAPAHSICAAVHLRQDRFEEALQDIDRALELRPGNAGDLHNRAVIWTALEKYDRAIKDYEAVLRIDPGSAGTLNNLAWVLVTAKDPRVRDGPRALAYALEAVRRGDTPAWLDTLAAAYAECDDFENAVASEEEAYRRSRPPSELFRRRLESYRDGRTFTEWRKAHDEM